MKKFYSLLFLLHVHLLLASQEILIDTRENYFLTSTPQKIHSQIVDPITGAFITSAVDLTIAGAQPLSWRRFYNHQAPYDPRYACWSYNPETFLVGNFEYENERAKDLERFAAIGNSDGTIVPLETGNWQSYTFNIQKRKGYANIEQNGQSHPFNLKLDYRKTIDPKNKLRFSWWGEIKDGTGRVRHFSSPMHSWHDYVHKKTKRQRNGIAHSEKLYRIHPLVWIPYQVSIHEEKLPNGNILAYTYERWKDDVYPKPPLISTITAYNSTKTKVLGKLEIHYQRAKHEEVSGMTVIGSDGRKATLHHQGTEPIILGSALSPEHPMSIYQYSYQAIARILNPDRQLLLTVEYDKTTSKVTRLQAPLGPNQELISLARYVYYPHHTEVYDGENNRTNYHFDGDKRIYAIITYQKDQPYKIDRYQWDPTNGNLLAKTTEDIHGNIYHKQSYVYDKNHNPIQETIGDYTLYRTYSDDGYNLKLKEWDDWGKKIQYTYIPNTNLLATEFVYEGNIIQKRTFHTYDDCAVLVKTITDDGKNSNPTDLTCVTYRKIIETIPKQTHPCFGLPQEVIEKTIDRQGKEILLSRTTYTYHPSGKVLQEDHYDSTNTYCYTLKNEYNDKELLIATIDALGNKTTYTYDANFNKITEDGPTPDRHKEWTYDLANRITEEKERQTDGSIHTKKRKYDKVSNPIATQDETGAETRYEYDSLGRNTAIYYPDGTAEKKTYDLLDNIITHTDPKGYTTHKTYNHRHQPTSITHPDGTTETFHYNPNGTLKTHTDKNGATTTYTYDIYDHPIRTETTAGPLHKITTATYSPFTKQSETDPEGNKTTYYYDYAGRKVAEEKANKRIIYAYDTQGRHNRTRIADALYLQEYDNKNQLLTKQTILLPNTPIQWEKYQYDKAGNQTHIIRENGTTTTTYDTQNRPLTITDPLGHTTHYHYTPRTTTETDPNGITTQHHYDNRNREIETTKKKTHTLQKVQKTYDPNGNLIQEHHYIYDGPTLKQEITNTWTYGPANRIQEQIEAGTKKTTYHYDTKGRLQTKIKPDGTPIHHTYDDLGRLQHLHTTDTDIHYTYDPNNRPLTITHQNHTTTRTYNPLGNVTQETLGNGLTIQHTYDKDGRRIQTILPDGTDIRYTYKANHLHTITRNGQTHTYTHRDTQGHLHQAHLPFNLGPLTITRDPLYRWQTFETPYYTATYDKNSFDPVGNLLTYTYQDPLGTRINTYQYDDLNQLTQEKEHHYRYDSHYNRLAKDNHTYQINALSQITNDNYQYDPNGNLLFDGTTHYTYDTLDHLIATEQNGIRTTYTYDPFHRRLTKTTPTQTHHYLYDGQLEIGSATPTGDITELRILGEGLAGDIGAAVFIELSHKTYIPLHDHRGSLVVLIDPFTQTTDTYRYTAFGEPLTPSTLSPWRFASKRTEGNLIYFGCRYYSPHLGRWITPDPEGFADGPNLYAYLHNDPLTDYDPLGLWSFRSMYEWTMREAFPLTHTCMERNHPMLAVPAALLEVALWTGLGPERLAYAAGSFATRHVVMPLARATLTRLETRAALQAEKVLATRAEQKLATTITEKSAGSILTKSAATKEAASNISAESVNAGLKLNRKLAAEEIAGGHAFPKHAKEFSFTTREQMATQIENTLENPTLTRSLSNGRTAFWDSTTGSVVIRNPKAMDGGTTFIPKDGIYYFLNELK